MDLAVLWVAADTQSFGEKDAESLEVHWVQELFSIAVVQGRKSVDQFVQVFSVTRMGIC